MIYLDANSSSRIRSSAYEAVTSALASKMTNASSVHEAGRQARSALQKAREQLLACIGATSSSQLFFTSGGSEACNSLVLGLINRRYPGHIVSSSIEHAAMLELFKQLEQEGWSVTLVGPNADGVIDPHAVLQAIRKETALVSVMLANNETGAIQPVAETAALLRSAGYHGVFVSDAIQAIGKMAFSASELFRSGVDALAFSGHKIGAPGGIGAVVLAGTEREVCWEFSPFILGGAQERGLRAGTENLLGALAFGAAAEEFSKEKSGEISRLSTLRDLLWDLLSSALPHLERLTPQNAIVNTLLVRVPGCRGDDLVVALDLQGIAVSTGSACISGKQKISHVVRALGYDDRSAREVVRFSLDWKSSEEEIRRAAAVFEEIVRREVQL